MGRPESGREPVTRVLIRVRHSKNGLPVQNASVILESSKSQLTDPTRQVEFFFPDGLADKEYFFVMVSPSKDYKTDLSKVHRDQLTQPNGYEVHLDEPTQPPIGGIGWGLSAIDGTTHPISLRKSIPIGILDSGLDKNNPFLNVIDSPLEELHTLCDGRRDHRVRSHGTFCAGLVAGIRQHGKGIVGTFPGSPLIDLNVFPPNKFSASSEQVIDALDWSIDNGVEVIYIGIGSPNSNVAEEAAYQRAWESGIVLIAPAGNSKTSGSKVMYPARYPYTIAVSAVGLATNSPPTEPFNNHLFRYGFPDFNCVGREIDLTAPGIDICSIIPADNDEPVRYEYCFGTSESACFVAGAAAIILALSPSRRRAYRLDSPSFVRQVLRDTATPLGFGALKEGAGLLNVGNIFRHCCQSSCR